MPLSTPRGLAETRPARGLVTGARLCAGRTGCSLPWRLAARGTPHGGEASSRTSNSGKDLLNQMLSRRDRGASRGARLRPIVAGPGGRGNARAVREPAPGRPTTARAMQLLGVKLAERLSKRRGWRPVRLEAARSRRGALYEETPTRLEPGPSQARAASVAARARVEQAQGTRRAPPTIRTAPLAREGRDPDAALLPPGGACRL